MRFDIITLFPEMFEAFANYGVVGRAIADGRVTLRLSNLRDHGVSKHKNVDDTPYGGGAGMVMRVDCLVSALEALDVAPPDDERGHRVLLTPQGTRFDQGEVQRLARVPAVTLICGRYEGFDERIRGYVDEELSLGDFVLSGGELAAMAVIDACARLVPGVLGNAESLAEESHSPATGGRLEYPHFTRPATFRDTGVPDVLLSGNHAAIAAWRAEQSHLRTETRRPDLAEDEEA
jgi:tRNA (guanine37-N1)-methyltransferase